MSYCESQPTCFNAHDLKLSSHSDMWYCSMCKQKSTSNLSYSCNTCNFDICFECAANTPYKKEHSFEILERTRKKDLTCVECYKPIKMIHVMCGECKLAMCNTCAIAYGICK